MKIPQMLLAEFRRLTSTRMGVIALIALMCVPVLYGGLYLWANQNPYAHLNRIPAAIVVEDTGTTVGGKRVDYGEQVADQLVAAKDFDWTVVRPGPAATGVDDSRFDFSITFPADFSEALASSATSQPRQARVTLTTNDTNSYLATTIGQQAAQKIQTSIVQAVNKQAASTFLHDIATIRGGMVTAESGAQQLTSGLSSAQNGATELASGTSQLSSGASSLASGASQVAAGAQRVADGNAQLAAQANQAAQTANRIASNVSTSLPALRQQLIDQLTAAGIPQTTIDQVLAEFDPITRKVTSQAQTADANVQQLVGQVDQLSAGANLVSSGAAQTASGASELATKTQQAASGANSLASGIGSLRSGAVQLQSGLADGIAKIPDTDGRTRAQQAATIADPVHLANDSITSAGTYGAGLAPFFVALAAWIGIYALFLIVKPVSRRALTAIHSPIKVALAGWLMPGILGAIQMVGLFSIVAGALRFGISNPLGMFGVMGMASLAFAAIILALNVWLGSVGQFLGLVLMVVQLVTAGGTFPWQTLPGPLAALHHVLPMSYAVDGIRQVMYGGSAAAAWSDVGVLALWMLIALIVAAAGTIRMTHVRTLRDLQPSLIG
jgi:putative membrane protein